MNGTEIKAVRELMEVHLASLKELINTRFEAQNVALKLQDKEYSRRLDMLNGEADRLKSMQSTYLPREIYDNQHEALCKRVEDNERYRAGEEAKASQKSVMITLIIAAVSLIMGLISLIRVGG